MPNSSPSVALTVSIPVTVGGYTGQRDAWEGYTSDYAVSIGEDGRVQLQETRGTIQRRICFDRSGLEAALKVLSQYDPSAKPKPVMR